MTTEKAGEEEFLTDFLVVLARIHRRLVAKASELRTQPEWSDVTWTLEIAEMNWNNPNRYLAISCYVEGELKGIGGVAWQVESRRCGIGWEVERKLTLNADDDAYGAQTTAAELQMSAFDGSRALADALPGLVEELLQLPAPRRG